MQNWQLSRGDLMQKWSLIYAKKIAALQMLLPIGMFVASGFEHSIANMFLIPLAIVIRDFASPEFWHSINSGPEQFPSLTMSNFIIDNLIPVTIGNIIGGGLLVGLTYWIIYLRNPAH